MKEKQPNYQQDKEETIAYLERERGIWVDLKARDDRASGNDPFLRKQREVSMQRLDHLLEDLFAQNVMLRLEDERTYTA